jgi:hypothetical protein
MHAVMIGRRLFWVVALACWCFGPVAEVQASFPQLTLILPRGVQRGGERELVFKGNRLKDADELLFHSTDPAAAFVVRRIEPVDDNSFKAVVFVPDNCPLGEHLVQVRCKSGISDFRSFFVGALPEVEEKEPNGSLAEAQPVPLNSTVQGVVKAEDVDCFAVTLQKGQRLSVDVEALRLGTFLFDPAVAIVDEKRFEIAAIDDVPIARQDGVLSMVAPADGTYYVQMRETSYGGNDNCRYRLHVGTFPRPTAVYPAGGKVGEKVAVQFLGDAAGPLPLDVTVPASGTTLPLFATDAQGIGPTAVPFRVSMQGNVLEAEPNNDIATATAADPALSFNGVIGTDGDVDCFRFDATKGQTFDIECYARRLRSGLDPVISVRRADGGTVGGNDDSRGPDSYYRFQVPADGSYVVRVTDHLGRGRPDFVYRIELQPVTPSLTLSIPRIDRYSQTRQTIMVPRGGRYAVLINATRTDFAGDLALMAEKLPAGVTMHCQPMPAALSQMPVVFEAAADAPIAGGLFDLEARPVDDKVQVRGRFENSADFIVGPNNTTFFTAKVNRLAMAVIEPLPFQVELVQPKAPLVRNGTVDLKVVVTRAEGFKEPITVEFPFRSPGLGAVPNVQIPADKSEAVYTVNADGKAALGTWPIYVIGQANVGGQAWSASRLATLEVAEPFATAKLSRSSCEQGETAQIVCKLDQSTPFEGQGVARLQGLPPNTTATEATFTKDTKELIFEVKTDEKSPVGNHKSPFVELITQSNGEPVYFRSGQSELQIAAPSKPAAPKPAPQPNAQAAAAQPPAQDQPAQDASAKPAKPLSRLEKLRLQGKAGAPK